MRASRRRDAGCLPDPRAAGLTKGPRPTEVLEDLLKRPPADADSLGSLRCANPQSLQAAENDPSAVQCLDAEAGDRGSGCGRDTWRPPTTIREPTQGLLRPASMPILTLHLPAIRRRSLTRVATFVAAVALAACNNAVSPSPVGSPGASGGPSGAPSASPSPSTVGAIEHKTGATDVVLRMEQGGGLVPIDFLATQAPLFTLYGNGVIVFQRKVETFPEADASGVTHGIPWRTAKLDEDQIQELLEFATAQGALGTARAAYMGNIADAPSTIFTLDAGGLSKVVTIDGLSELTDPGPDALARAAFLKLANRLSDFDRGGSIDSDMYQPAAYRGVLMERDAQGVVPKAWPWPAIKLSDFVDPNAVAGGIRLPHRTMTPAEIDALGVKDVSGGLQGVILKGPDSKIYGLTLRPLLADEKE